jgi:glycosyltransferase involved in cell wall biosynthesis
MGCHKVYSVSVVIPCFNEERHIGACIDSVRRQEYGMEFEIIAVDNGSTDNTVRIIEGKNIALVSAARRGPAPAKNRGIERARGEILVFLDADCVAADGWLDRMIAPFEDSSIGCVAGELVALKPETELENFLIRKEHLSQSVNVSHPFLPYAATANAAYRREIFQLAGLFDEDLFAGEDADMSWRMQLQTNYKLAFNAEAVAYHPQEKTLRDLFRQKVRHASGSVALYKKFRKDWPQPHVSIKVRYWEYCSLARRLMSFFRNYLNNRKCLDDKDYITVLEAGSKLGLIKGSIINRVWYF